MIGLPFGLLLSSNGGVTVIGYSGDTTFADNATPPSNATAIMRVNGDGTISGNGSALWVQTEGPSFDPTDYEFRLDITAGSLTGFPSDPTGVWIAGAVGVIAEWGEEYIYSTPGGGESSNANFRVRLATGGPDLITQAVAITATSVP
jgi:hypothetical protein